MVSAMSFQLTRRTSISTSTLRSPSVQNHARPSALTSRNDVVGTALFPAELESAVLIDESVPDIEVGSYNHVFEVDRAPLRLSMRGAEYDILGVYDNGTVVDVFTPCESHYIPGWMPLLPSPSYAHIDEFPSSNPTTFLDASAYGAQEAQPQVHELPDSSTQLHPLRLNTSSSIVTPYIPSPSFLPSPIAAQYLDHARTRLLHTLYSRTTPQADAPQTHDTHRNGQVYDALRSRTQSNGGLVGWSSHVGSGVPLPNTSESMRWRFAWFHGGTEGRAMQRAMVGVRESRHGDQPKDRLKDLLKGVVDRRIKCELERIERMGGGTTWELSAENAVGDGNASTDYGDGRDYGQYWATGQVSPTRNPFTDTAGSSQYPRPLCESVWEANRTGMYPEIVTGNLRAHSRSESVSPKQYEVGDRYDAGGKEAYQSATCGSLKDTRTGRKHFDMMTVSLAELDAAAGIERQQLGCSDFVPQAQLQGPDPRRGHSKRNGPSSRKRSVRQYWQQKAAKHVQTSADAGCEYRQTKGESSEGRHHGRVINDNTPIYFSRRDDSNSSPGVDSTYDDEHGTNHDRCRQPPSMTYHEIMADLAKGCCADP